MFELFTEHTYLITNFWLIVVAATAAILERLTTRWLKRFMRRAQIPPDVGNGLILTARLLILVGVAIAVLHIGGVPSDIIVSFSALGGATVGFASQRTIGNLIAGIYLLVARPFQVGDYIHLDNIEGVVQEITMNYVKILTPNKTVVSINTQRILDKEVTNYRFIGEESKLYCYSFELNFDHSLPTEKLEELLDKVIERNAEILPRKPEYHISKLTKLERNYTFYIYVEDPEDIFKLYPIILREIIQECDEARAITQ
ncbi:mechanosensitive ion channel family protein [Candidatus Bathyarchaeota archaeon]|nr:mechanosensitive ion channel family protein [Candidatus Bathyarchaeota archaeon]